MSRQFEETQHRPSTSNKKAEQIRVRRRIEIIIPELQNFVITDMAREQIHFHNVCKAYVQHLCRVLQKLEQQWSTYLFSNGQPIYSLNKQIELRRFFPVYLVSVIRKSYQIPSDNPVKAKTI